MKLQKTVPTSGPTVDGAVPSGPAVIQKLSALFCGMLSIDLKTREESLDRAQRLLDLFFGASRGDPTSDANALHGGNALECFWVALRLASSDRKDLWITDLRFLQLAGLFPPQNPVHTWSRTISEHLLKTQADLPSTTFFAEIESKKDDPIKPYPGLSETVEALKGLIEARWSRKRTKIGLDPPQFRRALLASEVLIRLRDAKLKTRWGSEWCPAPTIFSLDDLSVLKLSKKEFDRLMTDVKEDLKGEESLNLSTPLPTTLTKLARLLGCSKTLIDRTRKDALSDLEEATSNDEENGLETHQNH
jgi:hypothetical protein